MVEKPSIIPVIHGILQAQDLFRFSSYIFVHYLFSLQSKVLHLNVNPFLTTQIMNSIKRI